MRKVSAHEARIHSLSYVMSFQKEALSLAEAGKKIWAWISQLKQLSWKEMLQKAQAMFVKAAIPTEVLTELSNALSALWDVWKHPTHFPVVLSQTQLALVHVYAAIQHADLMHPDDVLGFLRKLDQYLIVGSQLVHSLPGIIGSVGPDDGYDDRFIDREHGKYLKPTDQLEQREDESPLQEGYEHARS